MNHKSVICFIGMLLGCAISIHVVALDVVAEGRSPIAGNLELAKQAAAKNAIRNAIKKFGSNVQSITRVSNGSLVNESTRISSSGNVTHVKILDEYEDHDDYVVLIKARIDKPADCSDPENSSYNKVALLTKMPLRKKHVASPGRLGDVEVEFTSLLADRLQPKQKIYVHLDDGVLFDRHQRFVAGPQHKMTAVQRLAEKHNAQFVVSGEIVDLSMVYPDEYFHQSSSVNTAKKVWATIKKSIPYVGKKVTFDDSRSRVFAFNVNIYDGYSGEKIFDKDYHAEGVWDARYTETSGFASPRFWATDYGKKVSRLVDDVVKDLGEKINCQPFIMPVEINPNDKKVYMLAGTNNGVEIGDTFDVYAQGEMVAQYATQYSLGLHEFPSYRTLSKQDSQMIVNGVYPTYSAAKMTKPLRLGRRYVAVFW